LAKKLEIDFAPAMVGYEIRNRKTVPVFEGIVVCKEYETLLLEVHTYHPSIEIRFPCAREWAAA
jgi:xeroderma pigmentosum group C-complementing protein